MREMRKLASACIIDDDRILVYGMKLMMKEVEFCEDIIVFSNGQEAIDGLTELIDRGEKLPPVIFLDLNMPIKDGWEFLEDFLKIPNNNRDYVTIYIISSSVDQRDQEKSRQYGIVNNYILKPIRHEDLERILKNTRN